MEAKETGAQIEEDDHSRSWMGGDSVDAVPYGGNDQTYTENMGSVRGSGVIKSKRNVRLRLCMI